MGRQRDLAKKAHPPPRETCGDLSARKKVVTVPALWASADNLVLKLLRLSPLPDAWQAEAVVAVGEDSKPKPSRNKIMKIFKGV